MCSQLVLLTLYDTVHHLIGNVQHHRQGSCSTQVMQRKRLQRMRARRSNLSMPWYRLSHVRTRGCSQRVQAYANSPHLESSSTSAVFAWRLRPLTPWQGGPPVMMSTDPGSGTRSRDRQSFTNAASCADRRLAVKQGTFLYRRRSSDD